MVDNFYRQNGYINPNFTASNVQQTQQYINPLQPAQAPNFQPYNNFAVPSNNPNMAAPLGNPYNNPQPNYNGPAFNNSLAYNPNINPVYSTTPMSSFTAPPNPAFTNHFSNPMSNQPLTNYAQPAYGQSNFRPAPYRPAFGAPINAVPQANTFNSNLAPQASANNFNTPLNVQSLPNQNYGRNYAQNFGQNYGPSIVNSPSNPVDYNRITPNNYSMPNPNMAVPTASYYTRSNPVAPAPSVAPSNYDYYAATPTTHYAVPPVMPQAYPPNVPPRDYYRNESYKGEGYRGDRSRYNENSYRSEAGYPNDPRDRMEVRENSRDRNSDYNRRSSYDSYGRSTENYPGGVANHNDSMPPGLHHNSVNNLFSIPLDKESYSTRSEDQALTSTNPTLSRERSRSELRRERLANRYRSKEEIRHSEAEEMLSSPGENNTIPNKNNTVNIDSFSKVYDKISTKPVTEKSEESQEATLDELIKKNEETSSSNIRNKAKDMARMLSKKLQEEEEQDYAEEAAAENLEDEILSEYDDFEEDKKKKPKIGLLARIFKGKAKKAKKDEFSDFDDFEEDEDDMYTNTKKKKRK
ncbi:hypothetical protein ABSA28_00068 [Candidatus Hepatincolaceae symbiont of Richtersius coronifer]